MKPRIIIVGAGLGGCFLADRLAESWDVTIVEFGGRKMALQQRMMDTDIAAVTYPHIGCGLGGTTALWHNGLMEVHDAIFEQQWPFAKSELAPYYELAYEKLAGVSKDVVTKAAEDLRQKLIQAGVPGRLLAQELYYPSRRRNAWRTLKLSGRVNIVWGEVTALIPSNNASISHVVVRCDGIEKQFIADCFVLAAGGLGTPLLLQDLAERHPAPSLKNAGLHYEDHPSGFVGEVILDMPLYKLWNYSVPGASGNLRLPLTVEQDGLAISCQLRPGSQLRIGAPRNRVVSVLNQLRNEPFRVGSYLKLLSHWDDILEIFSFKFGIRLPTRHYALLMVAEQPPSATRAVWREQGTANVYRKWVLTQSYFESVQKAIQQVIDALSPKIVSATIFPAWTGQIFSSSHHSGTARLASSPANGVCDPDGCVFGFSNLYVCDGSLIPGSGYANTGLTIAALALRMARHLRGNR
ncbi:MAG: GMC oxidoreductase [Thiobacillaceae bacterium]